jgi:tetratricopeptide (TPR) repeat protein
VVDQAGRLADSDAVAILNRVDAYLARATLLLVLLLVPLAYIPLRHGDYVQDDHLAIERNPIVQRGDVAEIISSSYWEGVRGADRSLYRPVTIASYALERRLTGEPDALSSRVVNIALHVLATLALFAFVRRLEAGALIAPAAALIFALHPIHVEAVANIVGRAEILAALFSFVGLTALTYAGPWERRGAIVTPSVWTQRFAAWLAAALLFLALGSKEVALATPLLFGAAELLFRPVAGSRDRIWWIDRLGALAPSALAIVCYLALRIRVLERVVAWQAVHPFDNLLVQLDGGERFATGLVLLPRYVGLLFYPLRLSVDYTGPGIRVSSGLLEPLPFLGLLILSILVVLALRPLLRSSRQRTVSLSSLASLLFLLPYLIVGNLLFSVGTIFAERLMYMPSAGFCLLLAIVIGAFSMGWTPPLTRRPIAPPRSGLSLRLALFALAALVAGFSTLTWARCLDWRNDETVFRAATRTRPGSPRAHLIVGKAHADRGESEQALHHFDQAIGHYPEMVAAWIERGVVLGGLGRIDASVESFREAVRLNPDRAAAHLNLGIALRRRGNSVEAEKALRRALLWDPALPKAWASLGNLYLDAGRYREAAYAYAKAIALGRYDLRPRLHRAERAIERSSAGSTQKEKS